MSIELDPIASGYNLSKINTNFQKVEDELNTNVLRRDGVAVGEDNTMKVNLDMNSFAILNAKIDLDDPNSLITVGEADARYYNVAGDSLEGPMNAAGQVIQNLPMPQQSTQAVPKVYVDNADVAIRNEMGVDNSKSVRFPYAVNILPSDGQNGNKIFATDPNGQPVLLNLDDATRTDLAAALLDKSDPGGANLVGHNGRTVAEALDQLVDIKVSAMTDFGQYSAWPQGKVFSHNNKAYCLYNVGASHSSAPLAVYQQISDDGVTWTRPAPRLSASTGDLVTWPQGVSAWGAGSDGTNIWMAARYRRVSDETQSKVVILKSTDNGSNYTVALDPVPLYDSNGLAPVLLHAFASLPNGNIAFGYHFYDGEVGIVQFNPTTMAMTKAILYTKEEMANTPMLVEPTLRVYGTRVIGFLRTQSSSTHLPVMWYSDDSCVTFQKRDISGPPDQSPINSASIGGKTYVFYCGRYRNGNTSNALTNGPVLTMRVGTDSDFINMLWENFVEVPIAAVPSIYNNVGASGTGVQDVCVRGSKIVVCLSSNVGNNVDQADVYSVTIDLGTHRDGKYFQSEQSFTNSRRATDFPSNYVFSLVNVVDMAYQSATIRMNGQVVIQDQSDAVRWGSTTGAAAKLHAFNNGTAPAYLSANSSSDSVLLWGSTGITEVRAGTSLSNASLKIDSSTKSVTLSNPSNTGGVGLTSSGAVQANVNFQHPWLWNGGSGGTSYLWISGTNNIMLKKGSAPTSDTDGQFLVPQVLSPRVTTVAGLGTGTGREFAFATNGRKSGEGAGAGTGVPCYYDGSVWRTFYDNTVVAA